VAKEWGQFRYMSEYPDIPTFAFFRFAWVSGKNLKGPMVTYSGYSILCDASMARIFKTTINFKKKEKRSPQNGVFRPSEDSLPKLRQLGGHLVEPTLL